MFLAAFAKADDIGVVVPIEEGRRIASLIPGARFVTLDSANHSLLVSEPAWQVPLAEIRQFIGGAPPKMKEYESRRLSRLTMTTYNCVHITLENHTAPPHRGLVVLPISK